MLNTLQQDVWLLDNKSVRPYDSSNSRRVIATVAHVVPFVDLLIILVLPCSWRTFLDVFVSPAKPSSGSNCNTRLAAIWTESVEKQSANSRFMHPWRLHFMA